MGVGDVMNESTLSFRSVILTDSDSLLVGGVGIGVVGRGIK